MDNFKDAVMKASEKSHLDRLENARLREGIISDLCDLVEKMNAALSRAESVCSFLDFNPGDGTLCDQLKESLKLKDEFVTKLLKA